jgi:prepilin-type N-terminal cleavage/methylation domain-containing protein
LVALRPKANERGFTLVELLIVIAVLPLIVGALSLGLISVFSLQSGVSNRLGDTSDSQIVSSTFENDVQSAASVTTSAADPGGQCGPSGENQMLGLAWNTNASQGGYETIVSYAEVQNGTAWNLVRQYCSAGYSATPTSTTVISYNVEQPCTLSVTTACQEPPTVFDQSGPETNPLPWTAVLNSSSPANTVTKIEFALNEPNATEKSGAYQYTLAAVPVASTPVVSSGGSPINPATTAGCNFASPGTGQYASTMCLVDFSSLTGNNILAAESGCLEMSVNLPGGSTLYFCIAISGTQVAPSALPTWSNAFLGNSCSGSTSCTTGTPFYTGIAGEPALYQSGSGTTTITISNISVVNATGAAATGWEVIGADAESTDSGESISWTSDKPLSILNNDEPVDTASDPVGNACNNGAGLTESSNDLTVTCAVPSGVNIGLKTGTAMVWATTPDSWKTVLVGGGLQSMVFGLLLS